jgi:hypothetical protein
VFSAGALELPADKDLQMTANISAPSTRLIQFLILNNAFLIASMSIVIVAARNPVTLFWQASAHVDQRIFFASIVSSPQQPCI